jgi:long-subunit fatty acid transport protein
MSWRSKSGRLSPPLALALLAFAPAAAQESVLAIEFDFSNPGARSLGLGGAFAGLADDATAAFANPAGLVQPSRPEISVDGRSWHYTTPYISGGRISGDPTGNGLDTTAGLRTGISSETLRGLSFLSFVYPGKRWSLAIYRHQLANFEFSSEVQALIRAVPAGGIERFSDQRSSVDFEIVSHGISAGFSVTDRFSLGFGIAHHQGELQSVSELYNATSFFDPNPFLPEDLAEVDIFAFDSTDWGFNAGLLWEFAELWKLGGFYRQGADFDLEVRSFSGPGGPLPPGTPLFSASSPVRMPDVYGLGLSYRSESEAWILGFQWNRVEYATIIESLDTSQLPVTATVDDGDEFHVGAEYVFVQTTPIIAARGGVWYDPDHRLRATEDANEVVTALRPPGEDEIHFAAGVGLVFKKVQLDLGADFSERVDTVSLSLIFKF